MTIVRRRGRRYDDRASLIAGFAGGVWGFVGASGMGVDSSAALRAGACGSGQVDRDDLGSGPRPAESRSDFLNQITHASDAWISQPDWAAALDGDAVLADGDAISLGFDGSRGRDEG